MILIRTNEFEIIVTSVAAEFGIAHSIVSRLWRQFQTTGTAIRGFSSGRPRGTTPADDRRLHGGGLFARCPVRFVPLTPAHRRRRSLGCREHRNWRDNEWGRVLFTDESRFSLSSDSHRIFIWRERGSRNHPSNIIERDRYGGRGVLVWEASCLVVVQTFTSSMQVQSTGPVIVTRFFFHICVFLEALWYVWDFLGRRLAARTLPPVTMRELRLALQDEWSAMPQQLIDTLILSMGRRCETCLAVRGDHIPTKDRMFLAGHPSQGCFGLQSHCAPCYFFNQVSFIPLISLLVSVAYILHMSLRIGELTVL
ncbi:transposable element Tcb2 transposase [Trichonephila clavipes]|nr:transposable element Tcb2 transposase [Trichonephila clavipes]